MNRRSFLKGFAAALSAAAVVDSVILKLIEPIPPAISMRSFHEMLREYLPEDLLRAELMNENYLLARIPKGDAWVGAAIEIPYKASGYE